MNDHIIAEDNGDLVPVEKVLEKARALIPELLELLQRRTGHSPLVAIAAMMYARSAIVDATACARGLGSDLEQFYDDMDAVDAAVVKTFVEKKEPSQC